jgi:hypothetical protein
MKPRHPVKTGVSLDGVSDEMIKAMDLVFDAFSNLAKPGRLTHTVCLIALKAPADGSMPPNFELVEVGGNLPKPAMLMLLHAAMQKIAESE